MLLYSIDLKGIFPNFKKIGTEIVKNVDKIGPLLRSETEAIKRLLPSLVTLGALGPFCAGAAARSIRFTAARSTIRSSFLHAGEGSHVAVVRSTMLVVKGAGPAVRQQRAAAGLAAAGGTPEAFRDMVCSSYDKIAQIVRTANTPFTA